METVKPMLETAGLDLDNVMPMDEWRRTSPELRAAREAARPECDKKRRKYVKERIAALKEEGFELKPRVIENAVLKRVLAPEFVLYPDGKAPVTVAELLANPDVWHEERFADPLEPDYGGDPRIAVAYLKQKHPRIFSHAHGAMSYALGTPFKVIDGGLADGEDAEQSRGEALAAVTLADFYAVLPVHQYLFVPTRALWPAASINSRFGKSASCQLDTERAAEALTWAPGEPLIIENRLICDGGWLERKGCRTLNLYRPPAIGHGDPEEVGFWLDHVRTIYPDGHEHLIDFLAHRVQRPQEKINHAIVLGGPPGIGKDTILEPIKHAVGPWNFTEVSPRQLLGRFNSFLKCVILRVSEARDLGDFDRYAFYETTKAYWAAPPDVLRVDEKNIKEYCVSNVLAAIITTNHRIDGLYLPPDDRRHYCLWSDAMKEDFDEGYWNELWRWYASGGLENVAAFLRARDLSGFDPKKPPEKTAVFWAIADNGRAPEEAELYDELEKLGWPDAVTLDQVITAATTEIGGWLSDRKNRRAIPHKFERCGYVPLRNDGTTDGRWKVGGKNKVIYVRSKLLGQEQHKAAAELIKAADEAAGKHTKAAG